jgi:hypothetical protein
MQTMLCMAQCFFLKGRLKHFTCFCGHFSETETNLKQFCCSLWSDITILWEELDNTWENWQYKPVQPSMATSCWLLTRKGCNYTRLVGGHSTTISKSSPKPVWFYLGTPTCVSDLNWRKPPENYTTGVGTWLCSNGPKTKQQSSQ